MITYWEDAPKDKYPIVAYLCYKSRLSVFQREKVIGYLPHVEKLPYTASMLKNRALRGATLPAWYVVAQLAVIDGDMSKRSEQEAA